MTKGHLMNLIAHVRVRSALEAVCAVFLFILGPVMLCRRFPDWLWMGVVGIGFVLFCDAALGLIGDQNKLGVFSDWKKLILFIVVGLGGAGLVVVLYIVVLVALFPPI
jgi:hypothetical protein